MRKQGKLLNYNEWCCINSYVGWMLPCNHHRLYSKYIKPLIPLLNRYYYYVISNKNKKKLRKYYLKLKKKEWNHTNDTNTVKIKLNVNIT